MYQIRCTAKNSWWWAERLPETCSLNTNKIGIQHVCWFYSLGRQNGIPAPSPPIIIIWSHLILHNLYGCKIVITYHKQQLLDCIKLMNKEWISSQEERRGETCNAVCFITRSFCEVMLPTTACPAGLLAHTTVTNCHYYRCTEATVSTVSSHIWQCDLQVSSSKVTLTRGSDGTDLSRNRHLTDDSSIGSYKYEVRYCLATFVWTCATLAMT